MADPGTQVTTPIVSAAAILLTPIIVQGAALLFRTEKQRRFQETDLILKRVEVWEKLFKLTGELNDLGFLVDISILERAFRDILHDFMPAIQTPIEIGSMDHLLGLPRPLDASGWLHFVSHFMSIGIAVGSIVWWSIDTFRHALPANPSPSQLAPFFIIYVFGVIGALLTGRQLRDSVRSVMRRQAAMAASDRALRAADAVLRP